MADKTKRLNKVTREFNLGLNTIVEYLNQKGFEVEANPNAKITSDMYRVLEDQFQPDKKAKEQSSKIDVRKTKNESVSIEGTEEVKSEPEVVSTPTPAPAPAAEKVEERASLTGVKVVGKIDLDAGKTKKPVETPKPTEPVAEAPKVEVTKTSEVEKAPEVVKPVEAKAPEVKVEQPKVQETPKVEAVNVNKGGPVMTPIDQPKVDPNASVEKPSDSDKPEDDFIKARADKLDGPKVLGKIELPVEKKRTPINRAELNKKKRKRIKKDPVSGAEAKPGENRPAGQGAPGGQGGPRRPGGQGGPGGNRNRPGGGPRRSEPKAELSEEDVKKQIQETLARLSGGKKKNQAAKFRRQKRDDVARKAAEQAEQDELEKSILKVTEFVSANELANLMDVSVNEVISCCMSFGMFVSINQRLDAETIQIVAEEFGFETEFVSAEDTAVIEEIEDAEEDLSPRAPIVTVMGHVDHGKTSLLDYIRKETVAAGEAGGITQHIGAYSVKVATGQKITFLDTPGHEAFTAMRARGAKVTDIAIIIVAADDNVMPQTKEAINHAQAAGVPMIFAINKIDKPGANPDKIKEELSQMNILVEDWGGKYQCQEISAKKGIGIEELLEKVLLEAELMELKANPDRLAKGTIIESELDKGRGYVSTVLVQNGTLKVGSILVAGCYYGRVKAMTNEHGKRVKVAGPSSPVQLLGLNGAPQAGDAFNELAEEKEAKDIAARRMMLQREQGIRATKHITLDELGRRIAIGDFQELNVIVKGDVDGSIEALSDSLLKLSTEKISVKILHKSVGQITESDVLLATASDAIIVGFQVRPSVGARKLAEQEEIDIRLYSVIYQAIEELKEAMEGMLKPKIEEKVVANIEIREVFKITKVGMVAGCYVLDGTVTRNSKIRIIREGIVVWTGTLAALKRFKDDVKEVKFGYECGLSLTNYHDMKVGDILEAYEEIEVKQTLN